MIEGITATELSKQLDSQKTKLVLVDVREADEWEICRIEGAQLIPLSEFAERSLEALSKEDKLVLYCHHGVRSERAAAWLVQNGYTLVRNLLGGIDAWSLDVDNKIPRY
ncbi:MAG: rhodanese-like domain-containing protein [Verrucomicrobiota bacterium]